MNHLRIFWKVSSKVLSSNKWLWDPNKIYSYRKALKSRMTFLDNDWNDSAKQYAIISISSEYVHSEIGNWDKGTPRRNLRIT